MQELLRQLLNRLEVIGDDYEELYDSECRERMSVAVMDGFVRALHNFDPPDAFGLHSAEANAAVREAIMEYIDRTAKKASELGLNKFHDRLAAFQNPDVESAVQASRYDDFFGYAAPDAFDDVGNVVGQS